MPLALAYARSMRVFAIGDTHLSLARPKPMDVFGPQWKNHDQRIRENWQRIASDDDLLLIAGDISWAMTAREAEPDLEFIAGFKGRKLLLKGNHDYWWESITKLRSSMPPGIDLLQNDAHAYNGVAIAGARGWLPPETGRAESEARIYERETQRLRLSLDALDGMDFQHLIVMTHYPPLRSLREETAFSELIEASGAGDCVYGHLHGADIATAAQGERNGVRYRLVSADAVDFAPVQIWPQEPDGR
jgi:uncharacterized protein